MRLSVFILHHLERILVEWESFAKTLTPASDDLSDAKLRDHAKLMLQAIAADIETDQSDEEGVRKSKGQEQPGPGRPSAAATHGTLRQDKGFTLLQLTSEFRALRASVLRLWLADVTHVTAETSADMLRFNEAIDQALAESVVTYSEETSRTRDTFLAMLGHDLRSPLQSMVFAGDFLTRPEVAPERKLKAGWRVVRSAATMTAMVDDLLLYARVQLGGRMPTSPSRHDFGASCRSAVEDARAAHPDCPFEFRVEGDLQAEYDEPRLHQALSNLLNNAVQYRAKTGPVTVVAAAEADAVRVEVGNHGPVIPETSYASIFEPLVQLTPDGEASGRPATSVGLGLFIAREITTAHGGTLTVVSSREGGTVFTLRLPRRAPLPVRQSAGSLPAGRA